MSEGLRYMRKVKALRLGLGLNLTTAKGLVDGQTAPDLIVVPRHPRQEALDDTRVRLASLGVKMEIYDAAR